jgi:hypothetical protein
MRPVHSYQRIFVLGLACILPFGVEAAPMVSVKCSLRSGVGYQLALIDVAGAGTFIPVQVDPAELTPHFAPIVLQKLVDVGLLNSSSSFLLNASQGAFAYESAVNSYDSPALFWSLPAIGALCKMFICFVRLA